VGELLRCKLDYLQAENWWMQAEYGFLCRLIDLQKQLIHADCPSPDIADSIARVLAERQQHLQAVRRRSEVVGCELEVEEFVPFIYSFEQKIEQLQADIKRREAALQQVELAKLAEAQERRPEFKCIGAYESHSRILDRIKREIVALQGKRQRLEGELLALADGEESTVASQVQSRSKMGSEQTLGSAHD
jgi:hypothetical protein